MCQTRIRVREVGSGFALGQDSDLLLRMSGKHVIQAEIHTCPKCRFSGYTVDFMQTVSASIQQRFLERVSSTLVDDFPAPALSTHPASTSLKPALGDGSSAGKAPVPARTPLPHVQYHWAYRAAEALGLPPTPQGDRLLRAYWCLRLAPSVNLPLGQRKALGRIYLKGAIQKLRQGLRQDENPNRLYLIAELCRRNENFLLAVSYFRRFLERENGARYLRQAAVKLVQAARERTSGEMSMEEVLYGSRRAGGPRAGGAEDASWHESDSGEGKSSFGTG